MELIQYYLGCLSHASYLVADAKSGVAAVVDPQRDIGQYLADASHRHCQIKYVILTHFHADFLAGHIELRNRTGAKICLGARAKAEYEFVPLREGDHLEFGDTRLAVLETPGHTPESISILVFDLKKDASAPRAVLTGDTLFIGDVGRPDLLASLGVTADELAEMLYDSITNKLVKLPDETLVYPAHGAGSMCGKNLSQQTFSTMGEQKRLNYALQPMTLEQFKQLVTADQPEAPDYFTFDAQRNREERSTLEESLRKSLKALTLEDVLRLHNQGIQLLDVRDAAEFEGAHLSGAINIGLRGKYATWCGSLLDRTAPIVVIAEPGAEEEAIMRLGRIGFDQVLGYLQNGMAAAEHWPDLQRRVPRIAAVELAERLDESGAPLVVDVRTWHERHAGHIPGSVHASLMHLTDELGNLARDRELVVHCEGGYRSAIAASLLQRAGFSKVIDLIGGYQAWLACKLPTAQEHVATA